LTISKVNFEGKGGKLTKTEKKTKKKRKNNGKGSRKSSFSQFPRSILKAAKEDK
jgi:hypothetical protein